MFLFKSNSTIFKDDYKKKIKDFVEENDDYKSNLVSEDTYEWNKFKVEDFKKLLHSYDSIESSEFSICNHQWKIRIYFYGKFKNDLDYFKFSLINTDRKNNYIPTKFVPYFKVSDSTETKNFPASLLYNFNNNACYEYKIYNNDYKSFMENINNDTQLCIGIYMRIYNNIIIEKYINDKLTFNDIEGTTFKKENSIYFEWAIKDWENIKSLRYFESPLFIKNNDKWSIIIKKGNIQLKCYSFSLNENHFHIKSIIGIRYSDNFSKGYLSEESNIYSKESEITFNKELTNIETQTKIDSIESIENVDTIIICVHIHEYSNIKENHINKLKNTLIEDDLRNINNIKRVDRNYFEYKIENISGFLNGVNKQSSEEFYVGNYKWKLHVMSYFNLICKEYNNINIVLENVDDFDNDEFVSCKYLFYFKSSNKHYPFKPTSSLTIFNNTKKKSDYFIINKNSYDKTIKSFIDNEDNSLTIGVYIFIYDNFIISNYFNEIKEKGIDNDYDIINSNYYEWEIEDWDKLQKENVAIISSPPFKIDKYDWNVTFYPKEENMNQVLYFSNNDSNNKDRNIFVRCIFVIRNCNDFSCYEIQKSKIESLEYNVELKSEVDKDGNNILSMKSLKSYEVSKRRLIENNKVIFGVFIFKMKKKKTKIKMKNSKKVKK
ncbi:hypothetical protein BCR32DRAFT_296803 [Anaeromyces robustus]|uniref:MATH domain-containing protein n=1 Tax=Anaeromyces robustus TaxID=1754192 RepID=A0A1Y1WPY7_9FUNG|nr:hypothetical protein BCR32DRAFT_296803 [Anaeromyces robustus]|eukprot:ORX75593.1 hypothetical protein BCR32DRAFT_296803 [Anaeromyces robustus]